MKVVAIIQARLGSTRLPGKVLRDLCGKPMIGHVVERAHRILKVEHVQVAISEEPSDDELFAHLSGYKRIGITRGPEDDVLARYWKAANETSADIIVRITADCPLLSPAVSSRVVARYLERVPEVDFTSNTLRRTFPRGLDSEVFSFEALEEAYREARTPSDREHVTPFIWRQPTRFHLFSVEDREDRSDHRWTVDTEEDFELVKRIFEDLYEDGMVFEYEETLDCLKRHPDWTQINLHIEQKPIS